MQTKLPPRLNERLIIGTPTGPHSSVWRIWSRRDDVYLATGGLGGIQKFSFHRSGRCRQAFTKEHGTPAGFSDRAMIRWWRAPTPQPDGNGRGSMVLHVGVPTDTLSTGMSALRKPVTWVSPAPDGMATILEMFFTLEPREVIYRAAQSSQRSVIAYTPLPSGEAFGITMRHATWEGKDFGMPAIHHEHRDFIFTNDDPNNTGRPIRLSVFKPPNDGDAIIGWEHGGYPMPAGTWERIRPRDE